MVHALIDTTVLFAAATQRDSAHVVPLPNLQGIDDGSLPETIVLDYVLAETLNGLTPTPDTRQPSIYSTDSKRTPGFTSTL